MLQKQAEAERNMSKEVRPLSNQLMLSQTRLEKVESMFKRLAELESQIHTKVEVKLFDDLCQTLHDYTPITAHQKLAEEVTPKIAFALQPILDRQEQADRDIQDI